MMLLAAVILFVVICVPAVLVYVVVLELDKVPDYE